MTVFCDSQNVIPFGKRSGLFCKSQIYQDKFHFVRRIVSYRDVLLHEIRIHIIL